MDMANKLLREDSAAREREALARFADRCRREGKGALATILDNAVFVLNGGDLSEYDWATRADGKTDDVEVVEVVEVRG
jgi:hypothetical protein